MGKDEGRPGGDGLNVPLKKIWRLLCPTWRELITKEPEMIAMVALCCCRAIELRMLTATVKVMDATLVSRSVIDFKRGLVKTFGVAMFGSWLNICYSYCQSRLTWKWKRKLTHRLHDTYFSGINYYLIGEGGGKGGRKLTDADSRMTQDLNTTINGFAKTFSISAFSLTAGFFYTVEIYRLFDWKYAIAPYLYLAGSYVMVDVVMPVQKMIREIGRFRAESWGMYRYALARVDAQAESIASLKGASMEHKHIRDTYAVHRFDVGYHHFIWAKFQIANQFFMNHFMQSFSQLFCIGRGMLYPRYEANDTMEKMAEVRADIGVQFVLFSNCMNAARQAMELVRELQHLIGEVERVTDLVDLLEKVDREKRAEMSCSVVDGEAIEFDNVDIVTPKDVLLVKGLTFKVDVGSSLLLTGHNGAGKSSIFRCLAGLWSATGVIKRPGGLASGTAQEVFYIPQKPYNVIGTLVDQLTYPDTSGGEDLTKERITEILDAVDLTHLVEREGALTNNEIVWEDELSLGEKQRLAIARLIHHKPRFAILDECSSAITSEMEERMYAICAQWNITYITIAHRPVLRAYHDISLAIGDGKQGWKLEKIDRVATQQKAKSMSKASKMPKDVEQRIKDLMQSRSKPYSAKKDLKPMPSRSLLRRSVRMIKIWWNRSSGRSWPGDDGRPLTRMAVIAVLLGLQVYVEDYNMVVFGRMYGMLMKMDRLGLLRMFRHAVICAMLKSILWPLSLYVQWESGFDCAIQIENNLVDRYMSNDNFYKMVQIDGRIKDPEQRICEDIFASVFGFWSTILFGTALPFCKLVFFSYRVGTVLSHRWSLGIVGFLGSVVAFLKYFMPNYRKMYKDLSNQEGKFKKIHQRVKMCSESIAFFGGGDREKQMVNARFDKYMEQDWVRHWCSFKFNILQDFFRSRVPETLQWGLRFTYGRVAGGTDAEMLADRGSKVMLGQQRLHSMSSEIFTSVGQIMNLVERMAELSGRLDRVFELQEVLDELEAETEAVGGHVIGDQVLTPCPPVDGPKRKAYKPWKECILLDKKNVDGHYLPLAWPESGFEHVRGSKSVHTNPTISIDDVTLVTPRGQAIVSDLSVTVEQHKALMVTGRNATGKTSLVRAMAGLWPIPKGSIECPCPAGSNRPGLKEIFIVPQRIHMALGTLSDQITYPETVSCAERTPEIEEKLMRLLTLVGIEYLVDRWSGTERIEWGGSTTYGAKHGKTVQDLGTDGPQWHSGWDMVTRWEDVLSLGEQQRLGMARMFYHDPIFAVLDECTSAVSIDVEEQLYQAAVEQGITCITVSQRLSLPEFHNEELKVGEATESGFVKRTIEAGEMNSMASAT